jgi:hypothetical protein
MELKAVTPKLDVAEQLVKYKQALADKGERNIIMWLVAPLIPKHIAEFLDRFGVEHSEIHEAEFRHVASRHGYSFASEAISSAVEAVSQIPDHRGFASSDKNKRFSFAATADRAGDANEFLARCDHQGKVFFSLLFERQKSVANKTKITWKHESGFSMQCYFHRLGFVELLWGFPATNREGKPITQRITLPFDFAVKKNVPETFIDDFANALAAVVPLTGGGKRPNVVIGNLTESDAPRVVDIVFQFARRASSPV